MASDQPMLIVQQPEFPGHFTNSATVASERTQRRFSFRVRMKRSTMPWPSGSRTKLGELVIPRKASSCWKSSLITGAAMVVANGQSRGYAPIEAA